MKLNSMKRKEVIGINQPIELFDNETPLIDFTKNPKTINTTIKCFQLAVGTGTFWSRSCFSGGSNGRCCYSRSCFLLM